MVWGKHEVACERLTGRVAKGTYKEDASNKGRMMLGNVVYFKYILVLHVISNK